MAPTRVKNATPPAQQIDGAEIEVVEGTDEGAAHIEIEGAETKDAAPVADPGIEDLRAQLAEERRRREAAESESSNLRNQNHQTQREVADSRVLVLDATIQRQEGEKAAIMSRLREAKEAGDYDAELKATDELSSINIDLKQTKLGKSRLEHEIETGGAPQQRQSSAPANASDAVEEMISRSNLDPRSAGWLRSHPEFAAQNNNDKLQRAHAFAMSHDGVVPASDEYFRLLEERLGMRQAQQPEDEQRTDTGRQPEERRASAAPAAPVSRSGGMGGGGREIYPGITEIGNGKYRVSKEVQEAADIAGLTIKEYIENARGLTRGSDGQMH